MVLVVVVVARSVSIDYNIIVVRNLHVISRKQATKVIERNIHLKDCSVLGYLLTVYRFILLEI